MPVTQSITKRTYIRVTAYLAAVWYLFGAELIVTQWWGFTKDLESFRFGLPYLAAGVVSFAIFAITWGREGTSIDRTLNRPLGVGLIILAVVAICALGIWQIPIQIGNLKVGQAAPWAEQWAAAHDKVIEKYPDAVLTSLTASRDYDAPERYDASLKLSLRFFSPKASADFLVYLLDTNPRASVYINYGPELFFGAEQTRTNALADSIQISPRDALTSALTSLKKDMPGLTETANFTSLTLYLNDS